MKIEKGPETMKWHDAFERVMRQAEDRRAESERMEAERRHLDWQRALVLRLLVLRFGAVLADVAERIQSADSEALDRYTERLVVAEQIRDVFAAD